jgi:hypothetical protein
MLPVITRKLGSMAGIVPFYRKLTQLFGVW